MKSNIEIHDRENSPEAEQFLAANGQRLKDCCLKVLVIFNRGERLTTKKAAMMDIPSLPRRIMDLRNEGFDIKEEIFYKPGTKLVSHKEWFMDISKRPTKEQVIEAFKNNQLVQSKLEI